MGVSENLEVTPERHMTADKIGRNICQNCNNGWLSEIDNSCREVVKTFSLKPDASFDESPEIVCEQVLRLKVFLYKIAICFYASGPFAIKGKELFESFYTTGQPPDHTVVFYSNYMGTGAVDLAYSNDWLFWQGEKDTLAVSDPASVYIQDRSFKFYIKLGYSAFLIANSAEFPMVYDPSVLVPLMVGDKQLFPVYCPLQPSRKGPSGFSVGKLRFFA